MFSQPDMGSLMRPTGIPIECTLYLIGGVTTGQGLFRYSGATSFGPRRDFVYLSATATTQGSTSIGQPRSIADPMSSGCLRYPPN
jgi:hypothetical protein